MSFIFCLKNQEKEKKEVKRDNKMFFIFYSFLFFLFLLFKKGFWNYKGHHICPFSFQNPFFFKQSFVIKRRNKSLFFLKCFLLIFVKLFFCVSFCLSLFYCFVFVCFLRDNSCLLFLFVFVFCFSFVLPCKHI